MLRYRRHNYYDSSYRRHNNGKYIYIACIACGIILAYIGFPFAVRYYSVDAWIGMLDTHSILFLGSPIYSWHSWNSETGPFEFFIAIVLNTLVCLAVFWIVKAFRR